MSAMAVRRVRMLDWTGFVTVVSLERVSEMEFAAEEDDADAAAAMTRSLRKAWSAESPPVSLK